MADGRSVLEGVGRGGNALGHAGAVVGLCLSSGVALPAEGRLQREGICDPMAQSLGMWGLVPRTSSVAGGPAIDARWVAQHCILISNRHSSLFFGCLLQWAAEGTVDVPHVMIWLCFGLTT